MKTLVKTDVFIKNYIICQFFASNVFIINFRENITRERQFFGGLAQILSTRGDFTEQNWIFQLMYMWFILYKNGLTKNEIAWRRICF